MLKVFLVEDESLIREGLRDNIPWEQYGFQLVGEASDGEMALPLIRKTKPDVMITDIKMPFMDGLSLSKIVSTEMPKIKIIIISGYDDFEYARQAIEVGVEQYLLKPITKSTLKKVLTEVKEKIEQDMELEDYQAKFRDEMHEYEQFSRRLFFEKMLEGELTVKDIYDEAAKLNIEIAAPSYNLMFFGLQQKKSVRFSNKAEEFQQLQDTVLHYFLRHPQYILFSWNAGTYGVLVKSEQVHMQELTEKAIEMISSSCHGAEADIEWNLAVGNPVERLSMLHECYAKVARCFAYRFILPGIHILKEDTVAVNDGGNIQDTKTLLAMDPSKMDPEIVKDFLIGGSAAELTDFTEFYLTSLGEAIQSRVFRDYIILNVCFATYAFLDSIGASREEHTKKLRNPRQDMNLKAEEVSVFLEDMLRAALELRSEKSDSQSRSILHRAQDYIEENYTRESLSLNDVAEAVNMSPNYFSAIFSQNMQKTFVEYVTAKRMEKAKKLLKGSDKAFGEIALEVGYKDSHYFSFVFKKTVGCSPREYRSGKNK